LTLCKSILTIQLARHWICGGTGKSEEKLMWNLLAEIRQFSRFARDIEQNGHE